MARNITRSISLPIVLSSVSVTLSVACWSAGSC
jgi:hypothetical protein